MRASQEEIARAKTELSAASRAPGVDAVIVLVNGDMAIVYQGGCETGKQVEMLSLEITGGKPYRCTVSMSGGMPILPRICENK